jgi:site-specific DNA-methyltransferase (adenine-specific)
MSIEDISSLPISSIADKDSVCFLWCSVALLPECLSVLSAWGYKYKTSLFWRKIMSLGMGYWFRGQVEMCVLGVRGDVKAFRIQKPNFVQSKARNHSQKPDEIRELIDSTGLSPKIELFARERVHGWDSMGYDIDDKDIVVALIEKIRELGG